MNWGSNFSVPFFMTQKDVNLNLNLVIIIKYLEATLSAPYLAYTLSTPYHKHCEKY